MQYQTTILYTDAQGFARFKEGSIALREAAPALLLSQLMPTAGFQLRHSPVGFASGFHCTVHPQWVFILGGEMEIGLQGGTSRLFKQGECFYADDLLPPGAAFDAGVHGHSSRQVGALPLVTLFVRAGA